MQVSVQRSGERVKDVLAPVVAEHALQVLHRGVVHERIVIGPLE